MGLFSKNCAKTHLPVLYAYAWERDAERLTRVVCLLPGREPFTTAYDGYGLGLGSEFEDAKLVLESDYEGETYDELGESPSEPNQGYFHSTELMKALAQCPGFASFEAYEALLSAHDERCEAATRAILNEMGFYSPEGKDYEVVAVLEALRDGDEERAAKYLDRAPALKGFRASQLVDESHAYFEKYRAASAAAAAELVAAMSLKGRPAKRGSEKLQCLADQARALQDSTSAVEAAAGAALQALLVAWRDDPGVEDRRLRGDVAAVGARVQQALVAALKATT